MKGFARREFQLMLLRRMADFQPDLVSAACAELGVSHAQYMAAHNRWQSLLRSKRSPAGFALYHAVLGPPDTERTERFGDAELIARSWQLPGLWPQLRWQTLFGEGGVALHGSLIRAPGELVPDLPAPSRLAPWSCVIGDVRARFPEARQADPEIAARWVIYLPDEQHREWRLMFVHGLLQTADRPV